MQLAVVGSGYVGLVAGACLAEIGHDVIVVDNDPEKLRILNAGQVPIFEPGLTELVQRHRGTRLHFSDSLADAVRKSSVIFIAVGTPPKHDGEADLSYVEAVAHAVAENVDDYKVLVEKSTVPVLTHERICNVITLNGVPRESIDVVSNPEFLREGSAVGDFLYPDRIVVGSDSDRATALLREVYAPLTTGAYYKNANVEAPKGSEVSQAKLIVTSAKSAELIKHASNSFLAMKISFINAVSALCEAVGADVSEVREGIGSDSRIGMQFLHAGIGYGGSCFPKDLSAFHSVAREHGYNFQLLDDVMKINADQRQRFLRKVRSALWTLKGKKLAVLGLAFKGNTDDIRESPALSIIEALVAEGAEVVAFDPAAMDRVKAQMGDVISYADSAMAACENADALLILTEWNEFAKLDLDKLRSTLRFPIVIDGRNLYDLETMRLAGFAYYSVGRSSVQRSTAKKVGA